MRFLATAFGVLLGATVLLGAGASEARADAAADGPAVPATVAAPDPAPARPGTDAEARDYALREAASPEAREFVGGHGTVIGLLVFVALVLFIVWLAKEI